MSYPLPFLICGGVQLAWVAAAICWVWRRGDEVPLVIGVFITYVFSFRLFAILQGWANPVDISNFGFRPMGVDDALTVLQIGVMGESVLLFAYFSLQKRKVEGDRVTVPSALLGWLQSCTWLACLFCIPTALLAEWFTRVQIASGAVLAFESSAYLYLYSFVLISVAILIVLVWKCGGLPTAGQKSLALVALGLVAVLTFNPGARFQFLGWIIACTIVFAYGTSIGRKAGIVFAGIGGALVLFGIAGALRGSDQVDFELEQSSWERIVFAADANMLDGFVLVRVVYPEMLPFEYGGEHLEILERPIPRAWWPGKPVGGYMNELGLTSVDTGGTLGISPSLFGSFYQEGGVPGVIVCSLLYGVFLGLLVRYSTQISVVGGILIRAMLCAFLIPLLRGGDLPGVYAWGFMAFWPILGILWFRRHELLSRMSTSQIALRSSRAQGMCRQAPGTESLTAR